MTQKISRYKYVLVKKEIKAELDKLRNKGMTYDELVEELIKKWREQN